MRALSSKRSRSPGAFQPGQAIRPARLATSFRGPGLFNHVLALTLLALAHCFCSRAQEATKSEYEVEAAFLYHFAEFVAWPPEAFAAPDSPILIGVVYGDAFANELEPMIRNKTVQGRPLVVVRLNPKTPAEARRCHILFIGAVEPKRVSELLSAVNGAPVLTVSPMESFTAAGGAINFVIVDKKVRFEINDDAARQAGLKISAKLLNLARRKRAGLELRLPFLALQTVPIGLFNRQVVKPVPCEISIHITETRGSQTS